jgi:hypothetical protein
MITDNDGYLFSRDPDAPVIAERLEHAMWALQGALSAIPAGHPERQKIERELEMIDATLAKARGQA